MKTLLLYGIFLSTGLVTGWHAGWYEKQEDVLRHPLSVKLYRFRLNADRMQAYHDWVRWQHNDHAAILASLEREKMYVEAVFRDTTGSDSTSIYWLVINGEGGAGYASSPLKVDSIHAAFMQRILEKGSRSVFSTSFVLMPPFIEASIASHQTTGK